MEVRISGIPEADSKEPETDILEIAPSTLEDIVGWSAETGPFTLRDFIASRSEKTAIEFGIPYSPTKRLKAIWEMSDEEIRETICAAVAQLPEGFVLARM